MRTFGRSGPLLIAILILISYSAVAQVYYEDFTGEADGAASGTAIGGTWSTILPPNGAASFSRFNAGVPYGGIFRINNTGGEGVWSSNAIDISTLGEVALEVLMGGNNATSADYIRAYYKINGGAEIMFAEVLGATGLVVFTASSAVVSGNTLEIVIKGTDASGGGGLMGFDDVRVTDMSVLYSIANTAWNVGTTWSITGFGGAACGCTPNIDSRAIIGNGRNVTFTADGIAAGLEIQSTGTLTWLTNNNSDLTIQRGGLLTIQNGGSLTKGSTLASTIQFVNYTYLVNNAGTLDIGQLVFNASGSSILTNTGTITLGTASGLTINGGNAYVLNNSGTFNLTDMDLNMADITFNNSGTISQTGNFTDVDAGSTFNNLANGTWNFSGTVTSNVRLFANNNSNTFNYNGVAQNIITPQDAYSNLTLSNSGAKTALANFSVRGNWTRSGTATFTNGGFRVTMDGSIAQSISAVGGESFANLTINNSLVTSPQIIVNNPVTVSTNLIMLDGNINLNTNTVTLSSSLVGALTHSMVSTAGWMYGGSLVRNYPTTVIAVGTIAGYYPLGGATDSRPFFIGKANAVASNGTITISYTDATTATDVSFLDGAATIQRRHDSFWAVARTVGGAGTFDIRAGGTGFTVGNINHTRITRLADAIGIGTSAAAGGSVADVRANRTGLTAGQLANNFYLASTNSAATPLPIELAWFRAQVDGDEVITSWKTAQEKNNHYFTVEKTIDFEAFYEVGRIDGKGTSAEEASYSLIDDSPFMGRSYYRLRQTDFDGVFTVSNPVAIEYSGPSSPFLKAYPNPFAGEKIILEVKGIKDLHVVPVNLYNQQGKKIMELRIDEDGAGVFKKEIVFPDNLPAGLYFLKAGNTLQLTAKLLVN
jgi:hypothetical protein